MYLHAHLYAVRKWGSQRHGEPPDAGTENPLKRALREQSKFVTAELFYSL